VLRSLCSRYRDNSFSFCTNGLNLPRFGGHVTRKNTYVGTVAEFSPTTMPLTLTPGRHHIELRVAGYQTMAFDTEVVAGQVIPYRGEMQPQR